MQLDTNHGRGGISGRDSPPSTSAYKKTRLAIAACQAILAILFPVALLSGLLEPGSFFNGPNRVLLFVPTILMALWLILVAGGIGRALIRSGIWAKSLQEDRERASGLKVHLLRHLAHLSTAATKLGASRLFLGFCELLVVMCAGSPMFLAPLPTEFRVQKGVEFYEIAHFAGPIYDISAHLSTSSCGGSSGAEYLERHGAILKLSTPTIGVAPGGTERGADVRSEKLRTCNQLPCYAAGPTWPFVVHAHLRPRWDVLGECEPKFLISTITGYFPPLFPSILAGTATLSALVWLLSLVALAVVSWRVATEPKRHMSVESRSS